MLKKILTACSLLLFFATLIVGHIEVSSELTENLEAKDLEVKLEKEQEEVIATNHLLELDQQNLLYQVSLYPEYFYNDYVVYQIIEDKPPRLFS